MDLSARTDAGRCTCAAIGHPCEGRPVPSPTAYPHLLLRRVRR